MHLSGNEDFTNEANFALFIVAGAIAPGVPNEVILNDILIFVNIKIFCLSEKISNIYYQWFKLQELKQ